MGPTDSLSHADQSKFVQPRYTLDRRLESGWWHIISPIQKSLTESLSPKLPDVVEEAKLSLDDYIGPAKGSSNS